MSFEKVGGISGEAVKSKTGKDWNEWIKVLDKAGAKKMNHKEIVAVLKENYGIGSWWQQMITVGYEQARGLRKVHETEKGFQISGSKTVDLPVSKLFSLWTNDELRTKWLGKQKIEIRKATKNKSIRISWLKDATNLEVNFYSKGKDKSQVMLEHNKIKNETLAAKQKKFWKEKLEQLKLLTH
ncbi:MAG: DUF4287 domain-containing protein [Ignavibacteriales bacterium]|nr:MAG: DUF4287 domain-containing protein [Ignavibacteriales bacterium]